MFSSAAPLLYVMQQTGAQGLDKATKLRICRNLATRLGIEHVSAPSINESSPGPLKPILNLYKDIEGLKKHRYKDYDAQLNAKDKGHRCGRHKTKEAARDIYRDAQTCNYRNEATWRDKVESKVMSRLSSEIQW